MIKILFVITGLDTGGAEMMLWKLLSRLQKERFTPSVVSLGSHGEIAKKIEALGIPVYSLGLISGRSVASLQKVYKELRRLARQIAPDLIQGWMYHGNLAALIAARALNYKVPVFWNIRQAQASLSAEKKSTAMVIWLGARLSRGVYGIINNSINSAIQHEQQIGYCATKRIVIPNGFDTEAFAPSALARMRFRSELRLSQDSFLVGFVGRYHPMKDLANFFGAADKLSQLHPQVHFVLAGEGITPGNPDLAKAIPRPNMMDRLHLLGRRSDISMLMASFDALVSSSYSEGFPNVVGEGMSCGLPVIVTDVGDSAYLVGKAGLLVPPRDSDALASGIGRVIHMSKQARDTLGARARTRIVQHFSLESIVRQYENIYEQAFNTLKKDK